MTTTTTDDLEGMLDKPEEPWIASVKLTPEEAEAVEGLYGDKDIPHAPLAYAKKLAEFMEFYKNLLRKYIAHIIDCEGSDYFSFRDHPFTPQELEELKRLSEEKI